MTPQPSDSLSFDEIRTLAERESGAHGLADRGLIVRASSLIARFNARGPYPAHQIDAMRRQVQRMLAARLRILLDRQCYPGIAEEKIERPIFIVGFARSGTTLLHSLFAEDPEVLTLQSWNLHSPSPPPGAGPVCAGRIAYAQRRVEEWIDFCPTQRSMHPYIDKGAYQLCEDEELFSLDFHNAYPYYYFNVPTLEPADVIVSTGIGDAYQFQRDFLQHLQWNTGKKRWVCKEPSAQMRIGALLAAFPDAVCVWPHRPLGDIYASNVALRASIYDTIRGRPNDWTSQPKKHAQSMKAAFDDLMANDLIKDPRILHLSFRELSADPLGVLRKVYRRLDLDLGPEFQRRVERWLADPENAADRYGRYPYTYEAFGLDREWIDELFAGYSQYFGLD